MERTVIGLVLAKAEGTYGTDALPTGASNTIAVQKSTVKIDAKFTHILRSISDGSYSRVKGSNVLPEVAFSFDVELRGNYTDGASGPSDDISSGSSAHAIEIDCLLQACDMSPAYTPETGGGRNGNVIYKPFSPATQGPSCTFYFFTGTKLHKIVGAKGTFKIDLTAGQFGKIMFSFSGMYLDTYDAALPSAGNYCSAVSINAAGTGYVVGDILTAAGGTVAAGAVASTFLVMSVNGVGALLGVKVLQVGLYSGSPTSPNSATGGTGTTASLTLTFTAQTAAVFLNTKPPIFTSSGSTVGSFTPVFTKLEFDLGAKVSKREDANSYLGVAGFLITDRTPKVTIDTEAVTETTATLFNDLAQATTRTITGGIGTQSGNSFVITLVGTSETVSYGDRSGIRTQPISYAIERANLSDLPNNEIALKFS